MDSTSEYRILTPGIPSRELAFAAERARRARERAGLDLPPRGRLLPRLRALVPRALRAVTR